MLVHLKTENLTCTVAPQVTKCPERKEVMLGRDNERIFHHWKRCGKFKSIIPTLFPPNLGKTVKKGLPPIFARKLLNFTGNVKHLKMTTNQSDVLSNCNCNIGEAVSFL